MSANCLKLNADKTEELGNQVIAATDHVRVLGVTLSSDLSLSKHVSNTCTACFYWLCQLRRVRRTLDAESAATLVHALVASRVDYTATLFSQVHPSHSLTSSSES